MSNPRYQTLNSATRAAVKLDSLLTLSRSLGGSCQDGIASDALDLLLDATGYTRGAAFILENGALELVAHRALPEHLRAWIQRLPLAEPSWFVAQVAVHARALVSAVMVSTAEALETGPAAFAAAGWAQAVACPIAAGHRIHGVMVLANRIPAEPDDALKAAVEIACCLLALQIPHRFAERRSDAASASQMAALGVLTSGLASELDNRLASIAGDLHRQEQLADRLKRQVSGALGLELEATARSANAALRHAEEIVDRLLATFQGAFPASPSEPGARESGAGAGRASSPPVASVARPAAALARVVSNSPSVASVPGAGNPRYRTGDVGAPVSSPVIRDGSSIGAQPIRPAMPPPRSSPIQPRAPSRYDTWRSDGSTDLSPSPRAASLPRFDARTAPTEPERPAAARGPRR